MYKYTWVHLIHLLMVCYASASYSVNPTEQKLNLAYTINIAKFIKWPDLIKDITICISQDSKIYPYVKDIDAIDIGGQRRILIDISPAYFEDCQIIYWDESSTPSITQQEIEKFNNNSIFVTNSAELSKLGFNIQFFVRNLKVRFHVDTKSIKNRSYQISSKLLRLSKNLE